MTIKQVHSLFEFVANKIVMIESFAFGTTYEFNKNNDFNYPQLYLEYPMFSNSVTKANKVYTISIDLIDLVDTITPTISRVNIVSKMEQLAYQLQEVVSTQIKPLNSTFKIDSITTILDEWSDKVSGVHLECTLSTVNSVNKCEIFQGSGEFIDSINYRSCL